MAPDTPLTGLQILFAGESWITVGSHSKGMVSYTTGSYEEGAELLIGALSTSGADVHYIPNHLAAEQFPRTPADLEPYDVIILSDIGSDSLLLERRCFLEGVSVPNRLESLVAHVNGGAGLAMIGGYMSFSGIEAKAHYRMTPLADVLPVEMLIGDDRMEAPQGVVPAVVAPHHEILRGIAGDWPYLLGYNKLVAKDDAEVLLSARGDPMLAVARAGTGHTAAFASDCSPHWGSAAFLSWSHYSRFWTQLVRWLAGGRRG